MRTTGKIKANLGESEHTIYIVGGVRAENARAYTYAVELGCKWAEGKEGGDDTFQLIWEEFWDIPAPNGGTLSYKHEKQTLTGTTDELLTNGKGGRGAWADFFKDIVGIHGIPILKIGIYPKKTVPEKSRFNTIVVKEGPAQGNSKPARVFLITHSMNSMGLIMIPPTIMSLPEV